MPRFLLLLFLFVSAGLTWPATAAAQAPDGLPARPSPFRFVTDEAQLLSAADAKTLESGLRRYADKTGTQLVVVTVPTLGGRAVADYGRALGEAWGIGQQGKNNGLVLLLSGQERKVTIQAGAGLRSVITPELTARVINQQMTPSFKQGNYFAGLRTGLNTLMQAADPTANSRNNPAALTDAAAGAGAGGGANLNTDLPATAAVPAPEPFSPAATAPMPEPASSGLGIGTLALGALLIGGVIWLLVRLFRRRAAAAGTPPATAPGTAPDFLGNRPAAPAGNANRGGGGPQQQAPDFYGNRGMGGSGIGGIGGGGMGTILATGAAAAAGAYLGNRMASGGNDEVGNGLAGAGNAPVPLASGAAGAAGGTDFPALQGTGAADETAPDYFAPEDAATPDASPDYFSTDDTSSYDDPSGSDAGGGGFDGDDDNSGSW